MPGINTSLDTQSYQDGHRLDHTPAAALAAGDVVNAGKGIIGYVDKGDGIAASRLGALAVNGFRLAKKAAGGGVTFAVGDEVIWDNSAQVAVPPGLALDGSADLLLGICVVAAADDDNAVVFMPISFLDRYSAIRPYVYEFDCDGANGDTDEHVLLPAWMNRHGLLFRGAHALITEVMAGSSEDQGIVTIEDEDDNALCTLTASDAAADAVNDVIVGTNDIFTATSGDAAKVVAAGKAIQGFVSQQTAGGTPAGKMKVYLDVVPLV